MTDTLGWGLLTVGLCALGIVVITCCWALLDGYEVRRDARRRNQARRRR
jgi:hypothetical protein